MVQLDSYEPTVPTAVVEYLMNKKGLVTSDQRTIKTIALAADKFLSETIYEAKQYSLLRKQSIAPPPKRARGGARADQTAATQLELELIDVEGSLAAKNVYLRRRINHISDK
jgi:Transcription initiation factor TFIID 23-30kDa subunit